MELGSCFVVPQGEGALDDGNCSAVPCVLFSLFCIYLCEKLNANECWLPSWSSAVVVNSAPSPPSPPPPAVTSLRRRRTYVRI